MQLIIVGLRRSGTTVFWRTIRQDARAVAYDEPFNPLLSDLPREHPKATRTELIHRYQREPDVFRRMFAPIEVSEELLSGLSERQTTYLQYLVQSANGSFVIDTTRCHFKIKDLANAFPNAVLVHLFREPQAFVSSHLLPTGSELGRAERMALAARRVDHRIRFWSIRRGYDNWGLETLAGNGDTSLFSTRLREREIDPSAVLPLPAVGRGLAYWRLAFETAQASGALYFNGRFLSIPFERFAEDPRSVLHAIYSKIGVRPPEFDIDVRAPNRGFRPANRRWSDMAQTVGIEQLADFELSSL